jgi:sugar diacid utilization regulator
VVASWPTSDGQIREQLSTLRSLLVLFTLLIQQDGQDGILQIVANAVGSLGPAQTMGIFLDGRWQDVRPPAHQGSPMSLPALVPPPDAALASAGGRLQFADVPWAWAYPLSSRYGPVGFLAVGAAAEPGASERFLFQVLAQQAGVALANASAHRREREQAQQLEAANSALRQSMEIHDKLTEVALGRDGQEGIAAAVHQLTGLAVAIEDRFGNLRAWAGTGRPDPYPKDDPDRRERFLRRVLATGGPVWERGRLISVAPIGGMPVALIALADPGEAAGEPERMAIEHATTVLAMEIARLQTLAEADVRLRINLVLSLVAGAHAEEAETLNRAQSLGYNLGQPHRVVLVAGQQRDDEIDAFFHAVSRAAQEIRVGSLLAPRLHDVVVLANREAPWEEFRRHVVGGLHGERCRVGVGGRCDELDGFARSYREAELALRIQKTVAGPEQVTLFDDLGVYKVLATTNDTSAMEHFVHEWLGPLMGYDAEHGGQLVLTLTEYLEHGGNYDASALALLIHRSTLKYRLRRIREVSGYDLSDPGTQFNLQVATRAWRTLQALRLP